MSTKNELRDRILEEMNARRIDHKTYIDSEWLLSEYEKALDAEIDTNTMSTKTDDWEKEFDTHFGINKDEFQTEYETHIKQFIATLITTLRKEQEEAYTKGYNAGLADGTGKPLLAIEQIREEAVAEAKRKHGAEKFIDGMVAATQWLIDNKHIAAGSELNRMMLAALTPQNTKTDSPQNYWDTHTVDGVIESIETLKKGIPDTH